MITRIFVLAMTLALTLASCGKEEQLETSDYGATPLMIVTDDGSRPLEIYSAICGVSTDTSATPYSYSYTSSDGTFSVSIEGSLEADETHTYATMWLRMSGDDSGKTIVFVDSSHPASRTEMEDVPVIMNNKE